MLRLTGASGTSKVCRCMARGPNQIPGRGAATSEEPSAREGRHWKRSKGLCQKFRRDHIGMGKKKVSKQNEAELIKETGDIEQASKKASVGQTANRLTKSGKVHIQATYNNTIISVTDNSGGVMAWSSAGAMGFKGAKKATPYAA